MKKLKKHLGNWKRNAVVTAVLLLICTGVYLNWSYGQQELTPELTQTLNTEQVLDESAMVVGEVTLDPAQPVSASAERETEDYFAAMRLSRQESRDQAVSLLQESIAYEDQEAVKTQYADQLNSMIDLALDEAQIESLLLAKGYRDCVTYISDDTVSVAVSAPAEGLDRESVARIADVVTSQTDYSLADVRIIEVK